MARVGVTFVNSRRTGGHHEVTLDAGGATSSFKSKVGFPKPGRVASMTALPQERATVETQKPGFASDVKHLGDFDADLQHDGKGLYINVGDGPFEGDYYVAPSFGSQYVIKNLSEPKIEKEAIDYSHPVIVGMARSVGIIPPPPANPGQPMSGGAKSLLQEAKDLTIQAGKAFAIGAAGGAGAKIGWGFTPDRFARKPKMAAQSEVVEPQKPAEPMDPFADAMKPAFSAETPAILDEKPTGALFDD